MGAIDILRDLMAEGVEFETDGNRIKWRNGGVQLTPDRVAVLKNGKADVLRFLNSVNEFPQRHNIPDTDAFEERAAIAEFDGGLTRADAEQQAAVCQGFSNVVAFRSAKKQSTCGN